MPSRRWPSCRGPTPTPCRREVENAAVRRPRRVAAKDPALAASVATRALKGGVAGRAGPAAGPAGEDGEGRAGGGQGEAGRDRPQGRKGQQGPGPGARQARGGGAEATPGWPRRAARRHRPRAAGGGAAAAAEQLRRPAGADRPARPHPGQAADRGHLVPAVPGAPAAAGARGVARGLREAVRDVAGGAHRGRRDAGHRQPHRALPGHAGRPARRRPGDRAQPRRPGARRRAWS